MVESQHMLSIFKTGYITFFLYSSSSPDVLEFTSFNKNYYCQTIVACFVPSHTELYLLAMLNVVKKREQLFGF